MVADPVAEPVVTPVVLTVAVDEALLDHVPVVVTSLKVTDVPRQIEAVAGVTAAGCVLTVIALVV